METGRLTQYQLFAWSQRRPYEVPLIDGELAWIVHRTADWIEAADRRQYSGPVARCERTKESVLGCDCARCEGPRELTAERMRADEVP
jgi:hypothetical protein